MTTLRKLFALGIWTGLGFLIGTGIAEWYKDALGRTGGTVLATDLLGIPLIPYGTAAIVGLIALKFIFGDDEQPRD